MAINGHSLSKLTELYQLINEIDKGFLGAFRGLYGAFLGPLWGLSEGPGDFLRVSWGILGTSWAFFCDINSLKYLNYVFTMIIY